MQSDPYKLMAWLVLLREPELYGRTNEDDPEAADAYLLTPLQALKRDVRNGEFEHVGVMPGDSKQQRRRRIICCRVEETAYGIPIRFHDMKVELRTIFILLISLLTQSQKTNKIQWRNNKQVNADEVFSGETGGSGW